MEPGVLIGLGVALGSIVATLFLEGGDPLSFALPGPWLLIIGGVLGVTIIGAGLHGALKLPKLWVVAIKGITPDRPDAIRVLVRMAERARREGLLALEEEAGGIDDVFLSKGIRLVVDGTDPELVKDILDLEVESMVARHHAAASMFQNAGAYAPTIGIIGTVMGLVTVLNNLSNPGTLGHHIASAFIATLLGVASANVIFIPLATRLKELSNEEADARTMMIEGILSIQAGDNPRIVEEKLKTFLSPDERSAYEGEGADEGASAAAERQAA